MGVNTQTNLCGIETHFLHGALTPRQAFPPHQTSPITATRSAAFPALQLQILLTLYNTKKSKGQRGTQGAWWEGGR